MKNILSYTKTVVLLLIVTALSLGFYAYMLVRPISYGMSYRVETVYESEVFEGSIKFYADRTMVNRNTNFAEEMHSRYYYKNGYIFFTLAETEDEYEAEVTYIDEHFEEAVAAPFYAAKINAFSMLSKGLDGYTNAYTCTPLVAFAVVCGIFEILLIGLTCASFLLWKKAGIEQQ